MLSKPTIAFETSLGKAYLTSIEGFLQSSEAEKYKGKVDLILTSPPFPLRAKKAYGNLEGEEYLLWLSDVMTRASDLLSDEGSLVIEVGNSWDKGEPTMSLLPLQALLAVVESTGFSVCQQFICHNPARLPGPAQWVTVNRLRMKDTYTHVWWLSKTPWVKKADNRKVLVPYSDSMKRLLNKKTYNHGIRPSGHDVSETGFAQNHGGAIASNVLTFANTADDKNYVNWCKTIDMKPHPARMPRQLAQFFIDFLTDEGDLVFDTFGGSLTTGATAEASNRQWIATEMSVDYLRGSLGRFTSVAEEVNSSQSPFAELVLELKRV